MTETYGSNLVLSTEGTTEDHTDRLDQINAVFESYDLAAELPTAGNLDEGQVALLGAERVVNLGGSEGLHMVELPTKFNADKIIDGEVKPGFKGAFWPIVQTKEGADKSQIVIPFVQDAPSGFETPMDVRPRNPAIDDINIELAGRNLRGLPVPAAGAGEEVLGINRIHDENGRFFSVVVYDVRNERGEIEQRPVVYNANSGQGKDGAVFVTNAELALYGNEPRILQQDAWRPLLGREVRETSRGFYDPSKPTEFDIKGLTKTQIPGFDQVVHELQEEAGVRPDVLMYKGKLAQDPMFEVSTPILYETAVNDRGRISEQDLDAAERIKVQFDTYGEFFSNMRRNPDAFSLAAISRVLINNGLIELSKKGIEAQQEHTRLVLARQHRVQHGRDLTEALRANPNDYPVDEELSPLAVNTGASMIMPNVYTGTAQWKDVRTSFDGQGKTPVLLYPYEAISKIGSGELDLVATAGIMRALSSRGYLQLKRVRY